MHWWFRASHHQVKIVLLVDLVVYTQRMAIYKYTEDTLTNPVLRHTNIITPAANTEPAMYQADQTDLALEFRLLFLRPPQPDTNERVIVLSTDARNEVTEDTWVWNS